MRTEPARLIAIAVGVLTAAQAAVAVLAAGGDALLAASAALGALIVALGGGEITRANVEPVELANERRDIVARTAAGEDLVVDDPDGR